MPSQTPTALLNLGGKWSGVCSLVEFLIANGPWSENAQYSPGASGLEHVQFATQFALIKTST